VTHFEWTELVVDEDEKHDESELFILPSDVIDHWLPRMAVLECTSWGQVKALGPEIYEEVLGIAGYGDYADYIRGFDVAGVAPLLTPPPEALAEYLRLSGEEPPADDDPFSAFDAMPMVADGDWPQSFHVLMAEELPPEIIERFATIQQTVFNGDFAHIELVHKDAVFEVLEQMGHTHEFNGRLLGLFRDL